MIKHKYPKIDSYLSKKKTITNCFLVSRGRYVTDICNIFGVFAAKHVYNLKTYIISDTYQKNYNNFFINFGFKNFFYINTYRRIFLNPTIFLNSFLKSIIIFFKIRKLGFYWFINNFEINQIKIGDLIYDSYTRKNHKYLNPKKDYHFFKILFRGILKLSILLKLINFYKPKLIFIGTNGYSYNDGLLMRIGLSYKIDTIEVQPYYLIKNVKFQTKYGRDHIKFNHNLLKNLKKKKVINHYQSRKKLKIKPDYTDSYFVANKFKENLKINTFFKNLSTTYQKIILIAPHAFSDAPHINGKLIFKDYYTQFIETLNFIKKIENKNNFLWIIKQHPGNFLYHEQEIFKEIVLNYVSEKVILCPDKVNTNNLIPFCDHVITTNGSIGIEFACEGKMPILGGYAPYSNLGFTFDSKDKEQYFDILKKIDKLKDIDKSQILMAKKALYILDTGIHKEMLKKSNILEFEKLLKSYNLGLLKNKFINKQYIFIKDSLKNLRKKKIDNDPYFMSLKNYFIRHY